MRRLVLATLAVAALAGPALAANEAPPTVAPKFETVPQDAVLSYNLIGLTVTDAQNNTVGEIKDLVIDHEVLDLADSVVLRVRDGEPDQVVAQHGILRDGLELRRDRRRRLVGGKGRSGQGGDCKGSEDEAAHGDLQFPEWVAGKPGARAIVPITTRNVNARNMEPLHA